MQICTKCGTQNDASATFCSSRNCGAVLEWHGRKVDQGDGNPTTEQQRLAAVKPDRPVESRQRPRQVGVHASLTSTMIDVEPGQTASCELRVRNQGTIVDQFGLSVDGPAAGWVSCEPPNINLYPDSDGTVLVQFAPPRGAQPNAGTVPFRIRITSTQDPSVSVSEGGMVTVAPFEELASELVPETGQGRRTASYELTTENRGNSPADIAVEARDPDQQLQCEVSPPTLRCGPGATQITAIDVAAKQRRWIGAPQRHPFTVTGTRPDDPARVPVFQKQGAFRQKAILPYWLLALLALLLLGGLLLWLLWPSSDNVDVPDVVGQPEELAVDTLTNRGLTVGERTFELSDEQEGTVIAQDPAAGESVDPDTEQVDIVVAATELFEVPQLVGLTSDEAEEELEAAGLTVGEITEEVSDEDEGTVIAQDLAAGEGAPAGTEIAITVAVWVDVPDVSGQSEGAAQGTLQGAGLTLGNVTRMESDEPEGTVIDQSPPAGETVAPDTSVEITVAIPMGGGGGNGIEVPDVTGESLQDAREEIEDADLQVGTVTQREVEETDAEGPSGVVLDQDPQADDQVEPGTAVDLVVRAVVISEGPVTFFGDRWIDLDIGEFAGGGAPLGADLRWTTEEVEEPELTPLGGAQVARFGTMEPSEFEELRLDELEEADFTGEELRGSELTDGTVIAVRTNEGNIGKLLVVDRDDPDLGIEYVTYEPSE